MLLQSEGLIRRGPRGHADDSIVRKWNAESMLAERERERERERENTTGFGEPLSSPLVPPSS